MNILPGGRPPPTHGGRSTKSWWSSETFGSFNPGCALWNGKLMFVGVDSLAAKKKKKEKKKIGKKKRKGRKVT